MFKLTTIKRFIKQLIPPLFLSPPFRRKKYGWFGDYQNWQSAYEASSKYSDAKILDKVSAATVEVVSGRYAFERDSVLFDKHDYSWPALAALLYAAQKSGNKLRVVDFGGALGSSYFQMLPLLRNLPELKWTVVEQKNFVTEGQQKFTSPELKFFYDIESALQHETHEILFVSSVIQYLEHPYLWLSKMAGYDFEVIVFDRTAFSLDGKDRLTVQKVPPAIYDASYPAWFLSEKEFMKKFEDNYDLLGDFSSLKGPMLIDSAVRGYEKGIIFEKKISKTPNQRSTP